VVLSLAFWVFGWDNAKRIPGKKVYRMKNGVQTFNDPIIWTACFLVLQRAFGRKVFDNFK